MFTHTFYPNLLIFLSVTFSSLYISFLIKPIACVGCIGQGTIVSSTSFGCPRGPERSNSFWCSVFPASNIFSPDTDSWPGLNRPRHGGPANYWLTEDNKSGPDQGFVLYLGCSKTIVGVALRNCHNDKHRDRSTKKFRLLGSVHKEGPWQELLEKRLEDSRRQNPPPMQAFKFANPAEVKFIKFEVLEYWGNGGGLQYFKTMTPTV